MKCLLLISLVVTPASAFAQNSPASDAEEERYLTDREGGVKLELPAEDDVFQFVVFGDRTGGPREGVDVLRKAVGEVNLFAPELVMTVGDLVQGYNSTALWLLEAAEFTRVMNRLNCPWFPVAGNHDIYWRGEGERPDGEHEKSYEAYFGPLWYAFRHRNSWFIVLYTDEGDPKTGKKSFSQPEAQRMSPAQFGWLEQTLGKTKNAANVFVFMHHPRWQERGYGEDWRRVHSLLAESGNVRAVFAGHIHAMQYDGAKDGIEYFTLATVGGHLPEGVDEAGFVDQYHVVTVRDSGLYVAALPVGAAIDPRTISSETSYESLKLKRRLKPEFTKTLALTPGAGMKGELEITWENPTSFPIYIDQRVHAADSRWLLPAERSTSRILPGQSATERFAIARASTGIDGAFRLPELAFVARLEQDNGSFVTLAEQRVAIPIDPNAVKMQEPDGSRDGFLECEGKSSYVRVPPKSIEFDPNSPFTLETWFLAERFTNRQGLVAKTQSCEYGFFVSRGLPEFSVHLNGEYVGVGSEVELPTGRWIHLAGVYDGSELRLYVDGVLAERKPATGARTVKDLPLIVGGDVNGSGNGTSLFNGRLDEVRLVPEALYAGESIVPKRRLPSHDSSLLHLRFDEKLGPWARDDSGAGAHGLLVGEARVLALD